jgi:opacity protein-like surface antigen
MFAPLALAVLLAASQPHDTVFTADGGRVVGTVVEEGAAGITVQLPDGTYRHLSRRDVTRIQYADGSSSHAQAPQQAPAPPPSAPPSYAPAPPPSYGPPPPPPRYAYPPPPPRYGQPVYVNHGEPVAPVYLTLGVGGLGFVGHTESGVRIGRVFEPQVNWNFEVGLRLNLHTALGLYGDLGYGSPASEVRSQCSDAGVDCSADTYRFGVFVRHTFAPTARTTPWVLVGTGYEQGKVNSSFNGYSQEEFSYSGWEMLRLQTGVDFRSSPVFGFGLYAGVSLGRFSHYEDSQVSEHVSGGTHAIIEGGIRLILFP